MSFRDNLKGVDLSECTLYLNVDPLPDNPVMTAQMTPLMYRVAATIFKRLVINTPPQPSFPAAVKWCWQQPKGQFFFHLEDDWELVKPVHIDVLMQEFALSNASWVGWRAYSGLREDHRICLSPGVFATGDAKLMAQRLTLVANPEKQLRPKCELNPHGGVQGDFVGVQLPLHDIVLRDIGREWLSENGWCRNSDDPAQFTTWSRI